MHTFTFVRTVVKSPLDGDSSVENATRAQAASLRAAEFTLSFKTDNTTVTMYNSPIF